MLGAWKWRTRSAIVDCTPYRPRHDFAVPLFGVASGVCRVTLLTVCLGAWHGELQLQLNIHQERIKILEKDIKDLCASTGRALPLSVAGWGDAPAMPAPATRRILRF